MLLEHRTARSNARSSRGPLQGIKGGWAAQNFESTDFIRVASVCVY